MKLLRYGEKGLEKTGLLDANHHIRDLSAPIRDIAGEARIPASLASLAA
ncbi:ureidoglycolate lyase, partial [Pseudomonas syringae]